MVPAASPARRRTARRSSPPSGLPRRAGSAGCSENPLRTQRQTRRHGHHHRPPHGRRSESRHTAVDAWPVGCAGRAVGGLARGAGVLVAAATPPMVGATPGGAVMSLGELAGLLGSFLVCAQLLLIARVPWFERSVGLDRLVSWHRSLGTTVVLLIVTHVVLMVVGGAWLDRTTAWAEVPGVLATQPYLWPALIGTVLFLAVGLSSARLARRAPVVRGLVRGAPDELRGDLPDVLPPGRGRDALRVGPARPARLDRAVRGDRGGDPHAGAWLCRCSPTAGTACG